MGAEKCSPCRGVKQAGGILGHTVHAHGLAPTARELLVLLAALLDSS